MLRLRLATLLFGFFLFQGAFAATFYYNDNVGAADGAWNNINNWWTDSTLTIQATGLPSALDDVIVKNNADEYIFLSSNSGGTPTVRNLTLNGLAEISININVTETATFNDQSHQTSGTITADTIIVNANSYIVGSIVGNHLEGHGNADIQANFAGTGSFYDNTMYSLTFTGNPVFYDNSSNRGFIVGNPLFYDHSFSTVQITGNPHFYNFSELREDFSSTGTFTFHDSSTSLVGLNPLIIGVFNDNSKNGDADHMGLSSGSSSLTFNDQSENFVYIEGNASFYDNSINYNTIAGDAYYACGAGGGAVLGTVTFGACPTPVSAPDLVDEKDTGASSSDDYTKEALPVFSGECEEGAEVHINVDGTTLSPTDICENGQYSITLSSALSAGTHDVKVLFSNPEGLSYGTSGLSPALSVNIDTNYPATTELNSTISKTSVALSFSTDELTMSTVSYGTTSSYGTDVTVSASLQNNHSVIISGLNTCNRYHYRIQTTDKAGNVSTTSDATFLTTCGGVSNSLPTVETPSVQNTPIVVPQNTHTPSIEKPLENTPANPTHPNETEFTTPATTSSSTPSVPIVEPEKKEVFIATILTPRRYEYGNVSLLQSFFNEYQGEHLQITGEYDEETIEAVNRFQLLYKDEILKPWGLTRPTGNVGPRTLAKINSIVNPNIANQ